MQTEETCGVKCWTAKQEECNCSCGGENHGIITNIDAVGAHEVPLRKSIIFGETYNLHAVGYRSTLYPELVKVNESRGWWMVRGIMTSAIYHLSWNSAKPKEHPPAVLKYATPQQLANYPELRPFRFETASNRTVSLLWVREEMPRDNYCESECAKCFDHRMKWKHGIVKEVK